MVATVTLATLEGRIASRLIDPSSIAVPLSAIDTAINDSVTFWKTRMFYFNQRQIDLTLDVSPALDGSATSDPFVLGYGNTNSLYPNAPVLPQNFLFENPENGFTIPYNYLTYNLKKESQAIYDNANLRGVGLPYIYCFRNGNYEIYFYPQIPYTLRVNYYSEYPPLVSPTDNNDFTNYATKLIEYDATARLLSDLRLDDERADRMNARAQTEYVNLKSRSRKQDATGHLTVDSVLS